MAEPYVLAAPLISVVLAFVTRRIVASLAAGVVVAAIVGAGGVSDGLRLLAGVTWGNLVDRDNLLLTAFSTAVAVLVAHMGRSGGTRALVGALLPLARGPRSAQLSMAGAGGLVFFDDYASCLVVGTTMGPVADRAGVSRAKLAAWVDAMAAPIASIAPVSTWIGFQLGLLATALPVGMGAMDLFLAMMPWRLYTFGLLAVLLGSAIFGRDFPAMAAMERATERRTTVDASGPPGRWELAAWPLLTLGGGGLGLLLLSGAMTSPSTSPVDWLREADSAAALFGAAMAALGVAALTAWRGGVPRGTMGAAATAGAATVAEALVILHLAWAMSDVLAHAGAAEIAANALRGELSTWALPLSAFGVATFTSLGTGSSWFTMGTLLPVALGVSGALAPGEALFATATAAAVVEGALVGDHLSPVSDTTVLSALSCDVDVWTHARTQLAYGATAATLAAIGFGVGGWVGAVGSAAIVIAGGTAAIALQPRSS